MVRENELVVYDNVCVGTLFIPEKSISEEDIRAWLNFNLTPAVVPEEVLQSTIDRILELYPDDPALGSPFNTGNETFGMPGFKRLAAICECSVISMYDPSFNCNI